MHVTYYVKTSYIINQDIFYNVQRKASFEDNKGVKFKANSVRDRKE